MSCPDSTLGMEQALVDLINGINRVMLSLPERQTEYARRLRHYGADEDAIDDVVRLLGRLGRSAYCASKDLKESA